MTETPEQTAFWAAIGAAPEDQLPRLVYADWLEENAKDVACGRCGGHGRLVWPSLVKFAPGQGNPYVVPCETCSGTGRVPDGRADLAAALRATVSFYPVPYRHSVLKRAIWMFTVTLKSAEEDGCEYLPPPVFDALTGSRIYSLSWRDYDTAADAIRDLCRAWIATRQGVRT